MIDKITIKQVNLIPGFTSIGSANIEIKTKDKSEKYTVLATQKNSIPSGDYKVTVTPTTKDKVEIALNDSAQLELWGN